MNYDENKPIDSSLLSGSTYILEGYKIIDKERNIIYGLYFIKYIDTKRRKGKRKEIIYI